jgi:hypothetical protein
MAPVKRDIVEDLSNSCAVDALQSNAKQATMNSFSVFTGTGFGLKRITN